MPRRHLPLSLLAPLAACGDLGERATTGDCPAGEVCSDDTPRGLSCSGSILGVRRSHDPQPAIARSHV